MNNLLRLVRPKPIGMAAPAGGWLKEISRPGRWAYPVSYMLLRKHDLSCTSGLT
jgi:hypothetical protein